MSSRGARSILLSYRQKFFFEDIKKRGYWCSDLLAKNMTMPAIARPVSRAAART